MKTITIPGDPVAQGRPKFAVVNGHGRAYDPKKSRTWKATAQDFMRQAADKPYPPKAALHVQVYAVFRCPKGDYRVINPAPLRWHVKRPDGDNILKAVKDAGSGVLWLDDAQVAKATVTKLIAPQGEAPRVVIIVRELTAPVVGVE